MSERLPIGGDTEFYATPPPSDEMVGRLLLRRMLIDPDIDMPEQPEADEQYGADGHYEAPGEPGYTADVVGDESAEDGSSADDYGLAG